MRHYTTTWRAATSALWLIALLAASSVSAGTDAALQVPKADLPKWNRAYKVSVWNFTEEQFPNFVSAPCSDAGYDTDPVTVALGACFYKSETNGTYSYWVKRPGKRRQLILFSFVVECGHIDMGPSGFARGRLACKLQCLTVQCVYCCIACVLLLQQMCAAGLLHQLVSVVSTFLLQTTEGEGGCLFH